MKKFEKKLIELVDDILSTPQLKEHTLISLNSCE